MPADTQPVTTARANLNTARLAQLASIDAYDADPSDAACDRMMQAQADYNEAFAAWCAAERGETEAIRDEVRAISTPVALDVEDIELLYLIRDRGPDVHGEKAVDLHNRAARMKELGLIEWHGGCFIGRWELTPAAHKAMGERVAAALGMTGEVA